MNIILNIRNVREKLNYKIEKKNVIFVFLMLMVFIIMLIFNTLTPLIADDYAYAFQYNNRSERVTNIIEIIISQNFHYLTHGGRYIAHFLAQFFLMLNTKVIFNILNAFMYLMLTVLIYLNCNYGKKTSISLYALINILLWLLVPAFGQAFLWLTGSCNYLWTTNIILLILLLYRIDDYKEETLKDTKIFDILILILGFLSGMTNENASLGLIAILAMLLFVKKIKGQKIKTWNIFGIIGTIIGSITLILAPGNFVRLDGATNGNTTITEIKNVAIWITKCIYSYEKYILLIVIILFLILAITVKKKDLIKKIDYSIVFFLGALIATYCMSVIKVFPKRSWTIIIVYMIISIGSLYCNINDKYKIFCKICLICLIPLVSITINEAFKDIYEVNKQWNYRLSIIQQAKTEGKKEVTLKEIIPKTRWNAQYELLDIQSDKTVSPNTRMATYFQLECINKNEDRE